MCDRDHKAVAEAALDASKYRLPTDVVPSNYELLLIPDLKTFQFAGRIKIAVSVKKATPTIVMNAHCLTFHDGDGKIKSAMIVSTKNGKTQEPTDISVDADTQRVTLRFASEIPAGEHALHITYCGVLNDKLAGFYRSSYTGPNGETQWIAATQFEATDARQALPCWDEPALKATFDVTLVVPQHLTALSNMQILESSSVIADTYSGLPVGSGSKLVRFAQSPIMSTYLLAFVIGEFDFISRRTTSGTEIRVYTPLGRSHLGQFSLDVAVRGLEFFNTYFDMPYMLPKCDLIAIPDFSAGAMENWGLITYREVKLLIDPDNSSTVIKQRCARTVCHELAHMYVARRFYVLMFVHYKIA
jgi:aminopeptidase N